jgi:uncharacterized linocin/CFP29 family protein
MSGAAMVVDTGSRFFASGSGSGRWATERLLKAMKEGREISPAELRTNDTLSKDEWKFFDETIIMEATIRLQGIADLIADGLTKPLPGALGKTLYEYEKMTDMNPATVSMDGMTRSENDRQEVTLANLPIPIIHKDFFLNIRTLTTSRNRGEGLDTVQARTSTRLCTEELERQLYQGGKTFGGSTIYGYATHPNRNTASFGTNGAWSAAAKTGSDILADVLSMMSILQGKRMYGPYRIYVASAMFTKLSDDFKANSDKSIMGRLLEDPRIKSVSVADQMPAGSVVMVQMTSDVVELLDGEPFQTIQWDVNGGMGVNFKVFGIQVPLIRADAQGRSGIVHMT